MKFLTYQPTELVQKLKYNKKELRANAASDITECSAENQILAKILKFSPIWCIPALDDLESIYNVIRCSPSFPQSLVLFEKDIRDAKFIKYSAYSGCLRAMKEGIQNVDFSVCVCPNMSEDHLKIESYLYEAVVSSIKPSEVRATLEISKQTDLDKLQSDLFEFTFSDKLKNLLGINYRLIRPSSPLDQARTTAWQALMWHKAVDWSAITDDTSRFSFKQFMEHCIEVF